MKDLEWERVKLNLNAEKLKQRTFVELPQHSPKQERNWIQIQGESLEFGGDRRILIGIIKITSAIIVIAILSKLL